MKSLPGGCNPCLRIGIAAAMALLAAATPARTLLLRVATLDSPVARGNGLQVRLDTAAGFAGGSLQVDVDALTAVGTDRMFRNLHWQCPLRRDADGAWSCSGAVRSGVGKPLQLTLSMSPEMALARLADGASHLELQHRRQPAEVTRLVLAEIPAAWLQAFMDALWKDARLQKIRLDGQLDLVASAPAGFAAQGRMRARELALETQGGGIAADGLDIDARIAYGQREGRRNLAVDASVRGGQVLVGGLYAALPNTAIAARVRAQRDARGEWSLPVLEWNDGAVLHAQADARWSPDAGLRALNLSLASSDPGRARERYLSGWLDPAGLAGLQLAGAVQASLALAGGSWRSAQAQLQRVEAVDAKGRFALHGLNGEVRWSAAEGSVSSSLRWDAGALFGMTLGPAAFTLRSQARHLVLAAPARIPMLGGVLRLDHFDYLPPGAEAGARFAFGLSLLGVDVAQLSRGLGWPAFPGTLDGNLPSAHYANNQLVFDGALDAKVFGGRLSITRMAMDRPFGADPGVSADLDLRGLDLQQLTSVFGFGQITGRLDGSIHDLRLLDWTPIAFDARLRSDDAAPDRRRISRRAVADLSSVGGTGAASGLQGKAAGLFKDFGYARLGISCRLANDVCHMDGVGSAGAGYTIVEGSGLPRINVIGFAREVDWPTLVARLKAAGSGDIVVQ